MRGRTLSLVILLSFFFTSVALSASYKSIARYDIKKAAKLQKKLKKNKKLEMHIPYKNYHIGSDYLKKADYQYSEEGEYELASYFAVLSKVEFQTAEVIAKTRLYKKKILIAERDEYREAAKKGMLKAAIASAGLTKKGKSYYTNIEDKFLFKRRSLRLSDRGERTLKNIYKVLKLFPESNLLIKGHTRRRDRYNKRSQRKSEKIAEYFQTTRGVDETRIKTRGYGNSEPMEVRGRNRRVDRVEIYIFDIDE